MMEDALRDEVNRMHAQVCSSLADANRILILYTLHGCECSVGEVAQRLNLSQPAVSRNLKVLRDSGIVHARREGQNVYYTLNDERIIEALDLLRSVMADILKNQATLVEAAGERFSA